MTLRFVAAGEQLKTLKLTVQTLGKFGHDVVIEAQPSCVHLRSVNPSKSAYARFTFSSTFFDLYELYDRPVLTACVLTKSLLASLRTQRVCR